jgi:hypothetical protein
MICEIHRWHNNLNPEVKKDPLSAEEEQLVFAAQMRMGNKWAEISKLIPGRTDNVVKNHFHSTLRRELRIVLRRIFGETASEPEEVSLEYLDQLMKDHSIEVNSVDNENVKKLLEHLSAHCVPEEAKIESPQKYILYYSIFY